MLKITILSLTPIWTVIGFASLAFGIATMTIAPAVIGAVGLVASYGLVRDVLTAR